VFDKCAILHSLYVEYVTRGADSDSQVAGIIMASAASLKLCFCSRGDNRPRNNKTNNAGITVGDWSPIPSGVGAYECKVERLKGVSGQMFLFHDVADFEFMVRFLKKVRNDFFFVIKRMMYCWMLLACDNTPEVYLNIGYSSICHRENLSKNGAMYSTARWLLPEQMIETWSIYSILLGYTSFIFFGHSRRGTWG
jgi:hypothetical protein